MSSSNLSSGSLAKYGRLRNVPSRTLLSRIGLPQAIVLALMRKYPQGDVMSRCRSRFKELLKGEWSTSLRSAMAPYDAYSIIMADVMGGFGSAEYCDVSAPNAIAKVMSPERLRACLADMSRAGNAGPEPNLRAGGGGGDTERRRKG